MPRTKAAPTSKATIYQSMVVADLSAQEKRLRILHVDDDTGFLEVTKNILEMENYFEIDWAKSVDEALRKLENMSYDVIVSDLEMPSKSGLDLLKTLKVQEKEIAFILFTGKGREEIAIKTLNMGADGYVSKQGDPETVYGELAHHIRQSAEKYQAKNALKQSEERLKAIVMNAPIGIAISNSSKYFINANEAFCRILGYTEEELKKLTFKEITHPQDLKESTSRVKDLETGKMPSLTLEKRYVRKDGQIIFGKISIATIRDKSGKAAFFVAELEDITERKCAEQKLKESEEKYKALFEQAGDYIVTLEIPSNGVPIISEANACAQQYLGYTRSELIGKPITFIDPESETSVIMERTRRLLNNENVVFEAKHHRKDGAILEAEVSVKKVEVGSKTFLVSVERDVTHRKKMEDEIKKERDMLENVTKSIGAGFIIISKDYHILWANNFIHQYKGEVDGKLCYSVLNTLDKPCQDCGVTKIFAGKSTEDSHEYFSTTVDGKPYWVDIIATPITDKEGNIVAASELAIDITEKKQREKDLKGSQQEFKALFNSNPEAVVYADESYNFVDVNPKFTEVFGYSPEEVKGKNVRDVLVPEHLKQEESIQAEKSLTEAVSFESKRKCKKGSLLSVFISIAPVLVGGARIGSVAVYKDMSDIIAAEQKIEASLKQSQLLNEKLNVIGSFTRHDVRNKLARYKRKCLFSQKTCWRKCPNSKLPFSDKTCKRQRYSYP